MAIADIFAEFILPLVSAGIQDNQSLEADKKNRETVDRVLKFYGDFGGMAGGFLDNSANAALGLMGGNQDALLYGGATRRATGVNADGTIRTEAGPMLPTSGPLGGYKGRYDYAMDLVGSLGQTELSDVSRNINNQTERGLQGLQSRGLAASTLAPALRMSASRTEAEERGRVNERIRRDQLNTHAAFSGDFLEAANSGQRAMLGVLDSTGTQRLGLGTQLAEAMAGAELSLFAEGPPRANYADSLLQGLTSRQSRQAAEEAAAQARRAQQWGWLTGGVNAGANVLAGIGSLGPSAVSNNYYGF